MTEVTAHTIPSAEKVSGLGRTSLYRVDRGREAGRAEGGRPDVDHCRELARLHSQLATCGHSHGTAPRRRLN